MNSLYQSCPSSFRFGFLSLLLLTLSISFGFGSNSNSKSPSQTQVSPVPYINTYPDTLTSAAINDQHRHYLYPSLYFEVIPSGVLTVLGGAGLVFGLGRKKILHLGEEGANFSDFEFNYGLYDDCDYRCRLGGLESGREGAVGVRKITTDELLIRIRFSRDGSERNHSSVFVDLGKLGECEVLLGIQDEERSVLRYWN